jgi:hypothetical protein
VAAAAQLGDGQPAGHPGSAQHQYSHGSLLTLIDVELWTNNGARP